MDEVISQVENYDLSHPPNPSKMHSANNDEVISTPADVLDNAKDTDPHSPTSVDQAVNDDDSISAAVCNKNDCEESKTNGAGSNDNAFGVIQDYSSLNEMKSSVNSAPRQPSLAEDSRLVKLSLPTNSINIIQSNTQFLNKSRNFLNFITEKSTNIMEKALLPQQHRYNNTEKKNSDDLSVNKFGSNQSITEELKNTQLPPKSDSLSHSCNNINDCNEPPDNLISKTLSTGFVNLEQSKDVKKSNSEEDVSDVLTDNSSPIMSNDDLNREQPEIFPEPDVEVSESPANLDKMEIEVNPEEIHKLRDENLKLVERLQLLEERNKQLELEINPAEIESREKTVERLTNELRATITHRDEIRREYDAANKERESMVMKYAVGEKQLIDSQRSRDAAEKKVKDLARENELLQSKLKQSQGERARICGIMDTKCRELIEVQKEVEKLKEEVNVREVKLKWSQSKLKSEMDMQKETQQKLEKTLGRITEMEKECEQVKKDSQDSIRRFQVSEENKAVTLDQQLKEQQAQLILERHVQEDKENQRLQLQKEVETLKNRQQVLIEENNALSLKVQDLEKDHLTYENNLSNLKIISDKRQKEIIDLTAKVSQLETLKLQLIHKEQCLASNEAEVERLRLANQEIQSDMDCCRQREAHMLEFTQKLTDKNVRLQSEFSAIEAKANQLEQEQAPLRECIVDLKAKVKSLEENFTLEKSKRIEECELLARHLAEQTQLAQNLTRKLEDSQGENSVLKRKHQISIKEMTRELQQCRKKLESYETNSSAASPNQTPSISSNSSSNSGESMANGVSSSEKSTTGDLPISYNDLDKNTLIERILKMQRINVRRAEKLDFLEEHSKTLAAELQKKTKIIQNYILHENFDAMGNSERDRYKNLKSRRNAAELARHGGIMASVYNHRVSDNNMTLELSLEINNKLQAVLEDALLKNITLKDNIDTLGEEIARLTINNRQLQKPSK